MKKSSLNSSVILNILILFFLASCTARQEKSVALSVSIAPLKYIVESITCGDFPVNIILPAGANPETYSPSPGQLIEADNSRLMFVTGLLEMEKELTANLSLEQDETVDLSEGISLKKGCGDESSHTHSHGTDPHIWTSPRQLQVMAYNAFKAIKKNFPDSVKYDSAYHILKDKLEKADRYIREKTSVSPTRSFIIYHPALTYYADDYSLQQIALEKEGKEPSAIYMQDVVNLARSHNIKIILYQREFAKSVVKAISDDTGILPVEIDPLKEDIVSELLRITDIITATE